MQKLTREATRAYDLSEGLLSDMGAQSLGHAFLPKWRQQLERSATSLLILELTDVTHGLFQRPDVFLKSV
jgi:hypothetical protein